MPSMSWDDELPDPRSTPCIEEMGVVADTFWRQPGVLRSDSPHSLPPLARRRASPPRTRSRSSASTARWGVYNWTGRCCCSASAHPSDTTIPWPELLAGCATAAPKSVLVRQGEQIAPRRLRRERPLLPELCPRGWLAEREEVSSAAAWWVMPGRAWSPLA